MFQVCRNTQKCQCRLLQKCLLVWVPPHRKCLPSLSRIVCAYILCIISYNHRITLFFNYTAPSVPKQPVIEVVNATAVNVSWLTPDHPNGIIREFQVIYTGYKPMLEEKVIVPLYFVKHQRIFLQQTREEKEILDGPKFITVPAKLDGNAAYSLLISDLVPGLTYEIKVSYPTELLFKPCILSRS